MPCYSVSPAYRRNVVHYNPFFAQPTQHAFGLVPRYSPASFFRSFEHDLAQFDDFFKEIDAGLAAVTKKAETPSFQPRFDIQEETDRFVLNGELPGVQPENLSIEFVNSNTLVVKGKVVRTESHGTPQQAVAAKQPEKQVQSEAVLSEDATMSGALPDDASETSVPTSNYHKASVEDEEITESTPIVSTSEADPAPEQDAVVKTTPQEGSQQESPPQPGIQSHYWVSERTVGEFSRAFRFPDKVNQDAVKASLKDGILTVSVPKKVEHSGRRTININA